MIYKVIIRILEVEVFQFCTSHKFCAFCTINDFLSQFLQVSAVFCTNVELACCVIRNNITCSTTGSYDPCYTGVISCLLAHCIDSCKHQVYSVQSIDTFFRISGCMGGGTLEAKFNRIHSQSQGSTECGSGYPVMSARVGHLVLVRTISRKRIILRKHSNFRTLTTVKFCTKSSIKIQIRTSYRKSMLF